MSSVYVGPAMRSVRIAVIVRRCRCTEDEARNYLEETNWNVEKAIARHSSAKKYNAKADEDVEPSSARSDGNDGTLGLYGNLSFEGDSLLPSLDRLAGLKTGPGQSFNLRHFAGAMQNGASSQELQRYMSYYDSGDLGGTVRGVPIIFYAVATNDEKIVKLCIQHGASITATVEPSQIPLLAFAIMCGEETDTTQMVKLLLSLGAPLGTIPAAFYTPPDRDLAPEGPETRELSDIKEDGKKWCVGDARKKFAKTANLSQRYSLSLASNIKESSIRPQQVAEHENIQSLLTLPYFLIGQTIASSLLLQKILAYITISSGSERKRPLILVFAGPSGHGKTELARNLGNLLSREMEIVDCTIMQYQFDLFGGFPPFMKSEKGAPLNNFLSDRAGESTIVFLDEFEKADRGVHQALLQSFDQGEYYDRRNRSKRDVSNTIFIATNALDNEILEFHQRNKKALMEDTDWAGKQILVKKLTDQLKKVFQTRFGAPLTGRVLSGGGFVPFLPFSPFEQSVIVHKSLLALGNKTKKPINLGVGPQKQLLGNVRIQLKRDHTICQTLANQEYSVTLGARSLIYAAALVEGEPAEEYLRINKKIEETDDTIKCVVDVKAGKVVVHLSRG